MIDDFAFFSVAVIPVAIVIVIFVITPRYDYEIYQGDILAKWYVLKYLNLYTSKIHIDNIESAKPSTILDYLMPPRILGNVYLKKAITLQLKKGIIFKLFAKIEV